MRLPVDARERYSEEWLSHLAECQGKIGKVLHSIGCLRASFSIRREQIIRNEDSSSFMRRHYKDYIFWHAVVTPYANLWRMPLQIVCTKVLRMSNSEFNRSFNLLSFYGKRLASVRIILRASRSRSVTHLSP
jgi:hypothetical protein